MIFNENDYKFLKNLYHDLAVDDIFLSPSNEGIKIMYYKTVYSFEYKNKIYEIYLEREKDSKDSILKIYLKKDFKTSLFYKNVYDINKFTLNDICRIIDEEEEKLKQIVKSNEVILVYEVKNDFLHCPIMVEAKTVELGKKNGGIFIFEDLKTSKTIKDVYFNDCPTLFYNLNKRPIDKNFILYEDKQGNIYRRKDMIKCSNIEEYKKNIEEINTDKEHLSIKIY